MTHDVALSLYKREGDPFTVTGRVGGAALQAEPRWASFGHVTGCGC